MTFGYYYFYIYLIGFFACPVTSFFAIAKKNFDALSIIVFLFFVCIIGMSCNYAVWVRVFSAMYGITWAG